jgi:hypothetical protein
VPGGRQQASRQAGRQAGSLVSPLLIAWWQASQLFSYQLDHILPRNQKYPCGGMVVFTYFCRQPVVKPFVNELILFLFLEQL